MLKNHSSAAIVAVNDIGRARTFYRDTLGLDLVEEMDGEVLTFRTGDTSLIVYRSEMAGSNKANAVVWGVGDEIDSIATNLKGKGVAFEHYKDLGGKLEGDVHNFDGMKAVWFKDPDGNILHLNSM